LAAPQLKLSPILQAYIMSMPHMPGGGMGGMDMM
jgi:hypothetical protein